ncbi:hypothetical protein NUACC21_51670 [Scytonema sp. NUACC21]
MSGTNYCWGAFKALGVAIGGLVACSADFAIAQITPDATLPNNSRVTTQDNLKIIEGGTRSGNNLFHSFEQFSVPNGTTAYFNNSADIQNIISRITGNSISNIDGTISANSTANLFLINPNGIIFGSRASLKIGGSFVASTANSLNFADGTKFSATIPQSTSLLTVSVPTGLQFGATAAAIRNQSQASSNNAISNSATPVGLQVQPGKTLALVGGDVTLEGGNLTARSGRIELGSVAANNLVSLNQTNQGWVLGYEGVQNFQNIQLSERTVDGSKIYSTVNTSGEGDGSIQIQGNQIVLRESSRILARTMGSMPGGNVAVNASESLEMIGPGTLLQTATGNTGQSGNIIIVTRKFIVRNGAQVSTSTRGAGTGGQLLVTASESVELSGSYTAPNMTQRSGLFSETISAAKAGDITINTRRLYVQDGAIVSTASSGEINTQFTPRLFTPGTGKGGNLTVNASESVELAGMTPTGLPSRLSASTQGSGDAGNLTLTANQLIVRDGAAITVSSEVPNNVNYLGDRSNLGRAGELNITARSILLDNQGKLSSETDTGQGGNISLQLQDLLLMLRNSQISTNAGKVQSIGNGGNIFINVPNGFIVAKPTENSDITANAFTGSGGKVQINATGIFGLVPRSRDELARLLKVNDPSELDPQRLRTSDITAISQTNPNLSGVVSINTPDLDPTSGFINLPVEPNEPKLASACSPRGAQNESEFIITGRGGLPPNPRESLRNHSVRVGWVSLPEKMGTLGLEDTGNGEKFSASAATASSIVEAQGWVVDGNGDITLVASAPTTTPHSSWFNAASCNF